MYPIQLHQKPTGNMNRDSSKMINLHSIQWQSWAPLSVPRCDGAQLKCRLTFNVLSVLMTRDKRDINQGQSFLNHI